MKVRVTHKYIRQREKGKLVTYRVGDEFEATESLYEAFKDRLALVEKPVKKTEVKTEGEDERLALVEKAKELGLNPHPNTGVAKLKSKIAEAEQADEETEDNGDQ